MVLVLTSGRARLRHLYRRRAPTLSPRCCSCSRWSPAPWDSCWRGAH